MKIKRTVDGVEMEFELTFEEMFYAHQEFQHKWDVDIILDTLKEMGVEELAEDYGISVERIMSLVDEMANHYWALTSNSSVAYGVDVEAVIEEVLEDYR